MNKEELSQIIAQLESGNSKEEPYLAIHMFHDHSEESFVKANKAGLELFAAEFLKASRDFDEAMNQEKSVIQLNYNQESTGGDIWINHIQPMLGQEANILPVPQQPLIGKVAAIVVCLGVFLAVVITLIIGIATIVKWFY